MWFPPSPPARKLTFPRLLLLVCDNICKDIEKVTALKKVNSANASYINSNFMTKEFQNDKARHAISPCSFPANFIPKFNNVLQINHF